MHEGIPSATEALGSEPTLILHSYRAEIVLMLNRGLRRLTVCL